MGQGVSGMKIENIEKALKAGRYIHLKDDVLVSYRDQQLDAFSRCAAEAHLSLCIICKRRLHLFQEELAAMDNNDFDTEDRIAARRLLEGRAAQTGTRKTPSGEVAWERFMEYALQAAASWQAFVMQLEAV